MRPGMQGLLRLLRDQPQPARVAESEWLDVLAIAGEENLLPWVAARLSTQNQLPLSVNQSVAQIRRQAQHEAFLWSATLRQMLSAFHERGIPVISLKGPWLAERLYGDAALRSYSDLDFLVRPSDWKAVEGMLSESGFSPCDRGDDRHRRWRRAEICIEPHFRLENPLDFDIDHEGLWSRARLSEFRGTPAWLLAPSDELMFLCVHAVRHCFERLSLLLDLKFAFRQFPVPEVPGYGPRRAELERAIALAQILVMRFEGSPPIAADSAARLPVPSRLEGIADGIWQRCLLQPTAPLEWRSAHRLYTEMEARAWPRFLRRMRNARILLTRFTEPDFALAARFHLRGAWQVWIFRQIRLVFKTARASRFPARTTPGLPRTSIRKVQRESHFRNQRTDP
jgi:hypothetical protein